MTTTSQDMDGMERSMRHAIRSSAGVRRLGRRSFLGRAAAGIAIPAALAAAGQPAVHAVADTAQPKFSAARKDHAMGSGEFTEERLKRMHDVMEGHVEQGQLPGLVTLVSRRGDVQIDAIGLKEFDGSEPMQRDSIFRIASVTKPIVAAAAMILVEECVLRLDDPVDELLPELANRQVLRTIESPLDDTVPANRPISLRDLLTLRLGIGAIFAAPGQYPIQAAMEEVGVAPGPFLPQFSADELMKRFERLPLVYQPGERWLYNTGSDILGVLIARASGKSLGDFLRERLFAPLGMKDTGFSVPAGKLNRLAGSYWRNFETGEIEEFDSIAESRWSSPPPFESGAGGLISTVDDLHAFGEMMLGNGKSGNQRILSRPSVAVMTTDQLLPAQKVDSDFFPGFWASHGWGFGMSIDTRRDDLSTTPGRYGWDGGYGTSWYVDPKEELIGILMTQRVWDATGAPKVLPDFRTSVYQALGD